MYILNAFVLLYASVFFFQLFVLKSLLETEETRSELDFCLSIAWMFCAFGLVYKLEHFQYVFSLLKPFFRRSASLEGKPPKPLIRYPNQKGIFLKLFFLVFINMYNFLDKFLSV